MAVMNKEKEKAKKNKVAQKQERNSLVKGMVSELKRVTWPTKKEVTVYTIVVVVTVVFFALVIGGYDLLLSKLISFLLSF